MGNCLSVLKPVQENRKKNKQRFHRRDWAELPDDLLRIICERIPPTDRIAFINVCNSWKSSIVSSVSFGSCGFPWLVMRGKIRSRSRTFFSILDKKVWNIEMPKSYGEYIWGSFQNWLIMVKHVTYKIRIEISLVNPFFRKLRIRLPSISINYHKLVLSESPIHDSCIYLLLPKIPYSGCALWISGCKNWCISELRGTDAVFYDGYLYLLKSNFDIEVVDAASVSCLIKRQGFKVEIKTQYYPLQMPYVTYRRIILWSQRYLVESCGQILLVRQFSDLEEIYGFRVYTPDIYKKTWVKLDNLDNRILFVGGNSCISYTTNELGVEIGNCIFFISSSRSLWFNEWDERASEINDWGIFNLSSDSLWSFNHPSNSTGSRPLWISAPMWWYYQQHGLAMKQGQHCS